jgi:uncharacterized membrane protein
MLSLFVTPLGHRMFAAAFIAFGLLQFVYGDFVPGRPPAWLDARYGLIWAYASGVWFVVAGAAIFVERYRRAAAFSIAALVVAWAVTRNLPIALADASFGSAWTRLGKALALSGGALAVGASARQHYQRSTATLAMAGRLTLGAFLVCAGVQHFLFADFVTTLVPAWIPGARLWTYVTGIALIAGGAGIIVPQTTRVASLSVALMIFTWMCILHIPRAFAAAPANQRNEWTGVFETLAFAGLALVLASSASNRGRPRSRDRRDEPIDRKPPSLPMLSTLILLPMLRIDAKLPMLRSDAALATDSTLEALSTVHRLL